MDFLNNSVCCVHLLDLGSFTYRSWSHHLVWQFIVPSFSTIYHLDMLFKSFCCFSRLCDWKFYWLRKGMIDYCCLLLFWKALTCSWLILGPNVMYIFYIYISLTMDRKRTLWSLSSMFFKYIYSLCFLCL